MDDYREAQLMRILEKRRRRGVLGVFDRMPGADNPDFVAAPPQRRRADSVSAGTQTASPHAEAATSPPPVSLAVQTSNAALDALVETPTQAPSLSAQRAALRNASDKKGLSAVVAASTSVNNSDSAANHTARREEFRFDPSGISSIFADVNAADDRSAREGGHASWRRGPFRGSRPGAGKGSARDPNYAPTSPGRAVVRYNSPTRVPSLMYSPSRSRGRSGREGGWKSPLSSPPRWSEPQPTPSRVSVPRPLFPSRSSPGRFSAYNNDVYDGDENCSRDAWRTRGSGGRSPSRFVPAVARRQSPFRGGAAAFISPLAQRRRRPSWPAAADSFDPQPLARWRSPALQRRMGDAGGYAGDRRRSDSLDRLGHLDLYKEANGRSDGGTLEGDRRHHHNPHRHRNGLEERRRSGSRGRSASAHRSKSRGKSSKKGKKKSSGKSRHDKRRSSSRSGKSRTRRDQERRSTKGAQKGGKRGLDPRLALSTYDDLALGHTNFSDDSLDSRSEEGDSFSSSDLSSEVSSTSSSTTMDTRERRRRKDKHRGRISSGKTKKKKRPPPSAMPFPTSGGGREDGDKPAGSIIPMAAATYRNGASLRQGGLSATRTNVSQSQQVNPNDQIGLPDVRSTIDLKTSAQVLHAGDWFYKWNRNGTEVHPRWLWVDLRSYLLVWSHRETRDPNFSGSVKLETISQIMPSELLQADDEGLPKTYYVLMIETTTRTLQLATERRNKMNVWFEALNNVVAFVRRRDIAKGTEIPD